MNAPLLEVENLSINFRTENGLVQAVKNVSFSMEHGGSLAIGHPFGATGARMVLTMAQELSNTDAKTALLGICAAGGLGAGAVLEAC